MIYGKSNLDVCARHLTWVWTNIMRRQLWICPSSWPTLPGSDEGTGPSACSHTACRTSWCRTDYSPAVNYREEIEHQCASLTQAPNHDCSHLIPDIRRFILSLSNHLKQINWFESLYSLYMSSVSHTGPAKVQQNQSYNFISELLMPTLTRNYNPHNHTHVIQSNYYYVADLPKM